MNLSLILVEGPHDCAVLSKVLRGYLHYSESAGAMENLPKPLPKWFEQWHAGRFPDLTKRPSEAWKPVASPARSSQASLRSDEEYRGAPKPSLHSAFESPTKQHLVLLLTSSSAAPWVVVRYCLRLKQALDAPDSTLQKLSICAFYDADQRPSAEVFQEKLQELNDAILKEPRNSTRSSWQHLGIEQTSTRTPFPLCISVFPGPNATSGTLEDLILPVLERRHPALMKASAEFLDAHAQARPLANRPPQYRKKAQIVIAGQVFYPDSACGILLQKSDFAIDSKTISQHPELTRLGSVLHQHFDASFH